MSLKRERRAEPAVTSDRPAKRPRVDTDLAQIWEQLADDDEKIRLEAASVLISKHCKSDDHDPQQIASRLFRGICSGRKSARPGFYVALVGTLSMKNNPFGTIDFSLRDIIELLETHTAPESQTSGQDERDHYYGRLLACKALFESGILENCDEGPVKGWELALEVLCKLMVQKPWLRAESSSVICSAISQLPQSSANEITAASQIGAQILKHFQQHKLLKTIEGVAVWVTVHQYAPKAKLPDGVWTSNNPLDAKDVQKLKRVLLDSKVGEAVDDEILGTSGWSPRLHPAWTVVLRRFGKAKAKHQLSFQSFWSEVVDDGLFNPASTPERKFTGFLVLENALKLVDSSNIPICFSKNLMASLIQALKSSAESYQRQVILKALTPSQFEEPKDNGSRLHAIIRGLLIGSDFADFDVLTKTTIVQSFFEKAGVEKNQFFEKFISWLKDNPHNDDNAPKAAARRKNLLNVMQKALVHLLRSTKRAQHDENAGLDQRQDMLNMLGALLHLKLMVSKDATIQPPYDEATSNVLKDKVYSILEVVLAVLGPQGITIVLDVVLGLQGVELAAEDSIQQIVRTGWSSFKRLMPKGSKSFAHGRFSTSEMQQVALLMAVLLYEALDRDTASVELLEEVNSMVDDFLGGKDDDGRIANQMVEIVLSLLSKGTKFHRRAGTLIFEAFATNMSSNGLQSLVEILTTKEGREGQQELFENGDLELDGGSDEDEASDDESLDSDVEIIEEADGAEASQDESADDSAFDDGGDAEEEPDDELDSFESALAAALGTRKLNQEDLETTGPDDTSDSGSDSDMSDSDMLELDEKLAEVFRNQKTQTSAQKVRKEEMKNAVENVVNLKNRAMDLVEVFFRTQQERGIESMELALALLKMAGTTGTPQLASRALGIIQTYVRKANRNRPPKVRVSAEVQEHLQKLLEVLHSLIGEKEASNALIDTASSLHIQLCRLLGEAGEEKVADVVKRIASEQGSKGEVKRKALDSFWGRYGTWANSKPGKPQKPNGQANGAGKSKGRPSRGANGTRSKANSSKHKKSAHGRQQS